MSQLSRQTSAIVSIATHASFSERGSRRSSATPTDLPPPGALPASASVNKLLSPAEGGQPGDETQLQLLTPSTAGGSAGVKGGTNKSVSYSLETTPLTPWTDADEAELQANIPFPQYPEVSMYFFKQTTFPRNIFLNMLNNPYPFFRCLLPSWLMAGLGVVYSSFLRTSVEDFGTVST